jgi:hypothetical protein
VGPCRSMVQCIFGSAKSMFVTHWGFVCVLCGEY